MKPCKHCGKSHQNYIQDDVHKIGRLQDALRPFVISYELRSDPIGESDLYSEQPVSVHVTLGDCRNALRVLRESE